MNHHIPHVQPVKAGEDVERLKLMVLSYAHEIEILGNKLSAAAEENDYLVMGNIAHELEGTAGKMRWRARRLAVMIQGKAP